MRKLLLQVLSPLFFVFITLALAAEKKSNLKKTLDMTSVGPSISCEDDPDAPCKYIKDPVSYRISDPEGDQGLYTGPGDKDGKAHGLGQVKYDNGYLFIGKFSHGQVIRGAVWEGSDALFTMANGNWTARLDADIVDEFRQELAEKKSKLKKTLDMISVGSSISCEDDPDAPCKDIKARDQCFEKYWNCCRTCFKLCKPRAGEKMVNVSKFEAAACSIKRGKPKEWKDLDQPFIMPLLDADVLGDIYSWKEAKSESSTMVRAMRRPFCGSTIQDGLCEFVTVPLNEMAELLESGRGDGPQVQVRLLNYKWQNDVLPMVDDNWHQDRVHPSAGDLARKIFKRAFQVAPLSEVLTNLGIDVAREAGMEHTMSALWVSSAGSRTSMHSDPWPSILVQLAGAKHVVVSPYAGKSQKEMSDISVKEIWRGGSLLGKKASSKPSKECLLRPGEMIFMPAGWGHDVYTVTPSMSLGVRMPAPDKVPVTFINNCTEAVQVFEVDAAGQENFIRNILPGHFLPGDGGAEAGVLHGQKFRFKIGNKVIKKYTASKKRPSERVVINYHGSRSKGQKKDEM